MKVAEKVTIRPFKNDYEALAEVWNSAYPDYPETAEENRFNDANQDPKCKFARFVAEVGGRVAGIGVYDQAAGMYHPQKFWLNVYLHADYEGLGIGSALYDYLLAALAPYDPLTFRNGVREDSARAVHFVKARGFVEEKRDWESRLDVAAFDLSPYEGLEARLEAEGVVIRTLKELEADPGMKRKFHALFSEVRLDVPRPEPATPVGFEQFCAWTFNAPDYLPEASFVALDRSGLYVGMSQLWKSDANPDLMTGLTAVTRAYRGRNIALALKLRGILYAKATGAPVIRTDNDSMNRPMLAINEKLGFVKQPAWINFVKHL
ncbi:MAG: GNAT family N-acetyltransferase [Deinococcota bacterium]|nr:GNAT family N-acetyltransferase [Deinococcota bacterium]